MIGILNSRFTLTLTRGVVAMASLLTMALLLPAVAAAQTPTQDQYQTIFRQPGGGGGGTTGLLPFTGLDLAALVAAGIALLATGLALERFRRRHASESR